MHLELLDQKEEHEKYVRSIIILCAYLIQHAGQLLPFWSHVTRDALVWEPDHGLWWICLVRPIR
jgi:hypothetical protein